MKKTAIAPSNIAFIKYWGKKDEALRLPENGSVSMNLSNLRTTTTVEFREDLSVDEITINDTQEANEGSRAIAHLDRVRALAGIQTKAKVVTVNNFPTGTGLSSSASGFAALSLAAAGAAGLNLSEKDLSILARQGSGSACRSIPAGFVEWLDGDTSETSYAVQMFEPNYWDIVDVVAVVSSARKDVSTAEGQKIVASSPFFPLRLSRIAEKMTALKQAMKAKNFSAFGEICEAEALELHAIMLTSQPSLIYWTPQTLNLMKLVKVWRKEGLPVYFTINTGQDIHLLCEAKNVAAVQAKLAQNADVKEIIVNTACEGAQLVETHLFFRT